MHELAVMFHWASLARQCLSQLQAYALHQASKKQQRVGAGNLGMNCANVCSPQRKANTKDTRCF